MTPEQRATKAFLATTYLSTFGDSFRSGAAWARADERKRIVEWLRKQGSPTGYVHALANELERGDHEKDG